MHFFTPSEGSRNESVKYKKLENHLLYFTHTNAYFNIYRSSHQRCYVKEGVLRNFAKFTGKHLCQTAVSNIYDRGILSKFHCCSLRQKCPCLEFFWPAFSRIWTDYGEILCISPYSVRMLENTNQKNYEHGHFHAVH